MSIGELSDTLVWGAATAYAVAFVAFAIDLARLADARQVRPGRAVERRATGAVGSSTTRARGRRASAAGSPRGGSWAGRSSSSSR